MIPHKTYIHHIPAVAYSVCLYTQSILQSDHFHGIISAQFSALHYYFSVSISSGNRSGLLFKNAFFFASERYTAGFLHTGRQNSA